MSLRRTLPILLAGLIAGPAGISAQRPASDTLTWPSPPEAARIAYTGSLRSEQDLGRRAGFFKRVSSALLGEEERLYGIKRPHDVHADAEGRMFLTNGLSAGVWSFDPEAKAATLILSEGAGAMGKPMGLDGDNDGHLIVSDPVTRRAVEIDYDGAFVRAWGGPTLLLNPVDVAFSPDGSLVYVVDSYLHQMLIFRRDGELVRRVGKDAESLQEKLSRTPPPGLATNGAADPHAESESSDLTRNRSGEPGEFRYPTYVATAPDGTVYVSDAMNFRVQAFSPEGDFLLSFGRLGDTPGSFSRPKGLATDSEGHIYVVDAAFNNVQVFDAEGRLLLVFGTFGTGAGEMWMPAGVAIDAQDRILVADRYNNRLQIFQYLAEPETVASPSGQR